VNRRHRGWCLQSAADWVDTWQVAATLIIYGLFGLCIGSFLNVVIWRVPQGMSIVSPGSACPSCGRELKAWENVPVVAWVALRGRCRTCHATISWRYPAVELATGAVFAALGARLGWGIAPVPQACFRWRWSASTPDASMFGLRRSPQFSPLSRRLRGSPQIV
jgi:Bacterial Peptidase A24 N-terminal domain